MSPKAPVFRAVLFDPSADAHKPLLELQPAGGEDKPTLDARMLGKFKLSSMILGLLVGFFIQFSTLGANFLVITIWGEDVISKSKRDIVVFSLLWSFFTSAMAIIILGFLRNLIYITYNAISRRSQDLLDEMVLHMECRFVVGALIGVCMAWTMTDVLLGMRAQILYSLVTLVIALFWCRVMMFCFASGETKKKEVSEDEIIVV